MTSVAVSAESEVDSSLPEKRKQCLLCPLPNDFLRVLPYNEDLYARGAVHREDRFLELAIIEKKFSSRLVLLKTMGLHRMSPYCRVRLGDARYETQTAVSSSKHPSWNELCRLPMSGDTTLLSVVLMNEGMLLSDSKIAWTTIPLPRNLFDGETVDMWYELSGKQGQGLEGTIHLSMRLRTVLRLVPNYRSSAAGRSKPLMFFYAMLLK
ncbi:hypothetical protein AHF37_06882 [Paragonimus kellicotti]|nr:hypothetical protein AHF37_06882 [Paragonimus kellicotti]